MGGSSGGGLGGGSTGSGGGGGAGGGNSRGVRGGRGGISIAPRKQSAQLLLQLNFRAEATMDSLDSESTKELNNKLCGREPKQPIMLFITASDPKTMKAIGLLQQTTLKDERVALGAKFFNRIRITSDTVGRGHPLRKKIGGKKLPRIILLTRDGKYTKKLEGRISASKLYSAMRTVVKKDSKGDMNKYVSEMRKILNELDMLDTDRHKWNQKYSKVMGEGKDLKKMALAKKDSAEIDARAAKLKKQVEELNRLTQPKGQEKVAQR